MTMTEMRLTELIDSWENLDWLINEIINKPGNIEMLVNIAMHSNHQKSWRAAWMMDKIHDKSPELITPFIPEIIEHVQTEKQEGKRRHFLKLISLNDLPTDQLGIMLDYCMRTFTSSKEPLAVRVHAMQILYNLTENEPELKSEILALIEYEMENHSSAGICSRGKKLVAKLRKQMI